MTPKAPRIVRIERTEQCWPHLMDDAAWEIVVKARKDFLRERIQGEGCEELCEAWTQELELLDELTV